MGRTTLVALVQTMLYLLPAASTVKEREKAKFKRHRQNTHRREATGSAALVVVFGPLVSLSWLD